MCCLECEWVGCDFFFFFLIFVFLFFVFFFFNDTATTEIYTLSLHDALPISCDVASLLRNVPLDETINIIADKAFTYDWFNETHSINRTKSDLLEL